MDGLYRTMSSDGPPALPGWIPVAVIASLTTAAALIGSFAAVDAAARYEDLEQPAWAPPPWLFGPVWTVLYATIAVAGWRIWTSYGWQTPSQLWLGQLALNAAWTPVFFAWELRGAALAIICALDVVLAAMLLRIRNLGWPAWLLTPYLAWVLFATALNASVWWLNR